MFFCLFASSAEWLVNLNSWFWVPSVSWYLSSSRGIKSSNLNFFVWFCSASFHHLISQSWTLTSVCSRSPVFWYLVRICSGTYSLTNNSKEQTLMINLHPAAPQSKEWIIIYIIIYISRLFFVFVLRRTRGAARPPRGSSETRRGGRRPARVQTEFWTFTLRARRSESVKLIGAGPSSIWHVHIFIFTLFWPHSEIDWNVGAQ